MKYSVLCSLVILFIASSCSNQDKEVEDRPNIIFIMADDHAYQAISSYDGSLNETPNIDKLAEAGIRFNNSFCTNSICGPSRAVMLTGKYSHINGHIDNRVSFDGEQQTFPKLLQKAGYQTAMVGKWHLKSDPTGFDYWNILPGQGHYYNPDFIENGERKRIEGYVTDITTDIAMDWLDKRQKDQPFCLLLHHKAPHRNWMPSKENLNKYDTVNFPIPKTFFDDYSTRSQAAHTQKMEIDDDMYYAYDLKLPEFENAEQGLNKRKSDSLYWKSVFGRMTKEQQEDWNIAYQEKNLQMANAKFEGKELAIWKYNRYMQDYLACIASVDENVGVLLKYLEENNLKDNTIIVYTSDQGFYLGEHSWFDKRFMYEQSLKTPLIISYPKSIKTSVNSDHLVSNLDYAPTLLDFAGITIPEDMQGMSMKSILEGKEATTWRDAVYYHYYEYPAEHSVKRHYGIRTDRYKLIHFYYDIDEWELYDLKNDPDEIKNIYHEENNHQLVDSLKVKLKELQKQYKDDEGDLFLPKPDKKVEHIAIDCSVKLKYPYHKKYSGGGNNALTNGIIAQESKYSNGLSKAWQAFSGDDLEAIVDLGELKEVNSISCSFLKDINSWIFLPKKVSYHTSVDGVTFEKVYEEQVDLSKENSEMLIKTIAAKVENKSIRYIKVIAENIGVCPDWHDGAGGKSWIFADEIIVQ